MARKKDEIVEKDFFDYCIYLCQKFNNIPIKIYTHDIINHSSFTICETSRLVDNEKEKSYWYSIKSCNLPKRIETDENYADTIDYCLSFEYNYRSPYTPDKMDDSLYMDFHNDYSENSMNVSNTFNLEFITQHKTEDKMPKIKGKIRSFEKFEDKIQRTFFELILEGKKGKDGDS